MCSKPISARGAASRAKSAVWTLYLVVGVVQFGGRAVTYRDWPGRLRLNFRSIARIRSWPSFSGLSPAGRCPMTTAAPSTALVMIQPAFTDGERLALAGFLAGYRGLTREAYALDLRQFTT